ncbi:MAG: DUF983 domain-containing protein [Proteobacteria bacterium]|nr:DUF983 domain-containing protein [Pseudomonadota bacterium]
MSTLIERWQAVKAEPAMRGLLGRCPKCGEGRLFRAFLKVADSCPACGEEMHHHRADDFPAYLVIVIVGHVICAGALGVEAAFSPALWVHAVLWGPATLGMALGLIQPVKGAVVGFQWQHGMEGFAPAKRARELAAI